MTGGKNTPLQTDQDSYSKFQHLEWIPKLCEQQTDSPEKKFLNTQLHMDSIKWLTDTNSQTGRKEIANLAYNTTPWHLPED